MTGDDPADGLTDEAVAEAARRLLIEVELIGDQAELGLRSESLRGAMAALGRTAADLEAADARLAWDWLTEGAARLRRAGYPDVAHLFDDFKRLVIAVQFSNYGQQFLIETGLRLRET